MAIYNLDENEEIDTIKINGRDYLVGDIPIRILEKIQKIKAPLFCFDREHEILKQWQPILKEILEIKNRDLEMESFTRPLTVKLIQTILGKVQKGQIG